MCNNFPNIRITEGNNFSIILPLRSRTYVATKPIDEDIDTEQLENVVVTFGGVEYPAQRTAQGVQIDLPATLAVGTYNILLTAEYLESSIRAAYESAVTIVPWSAQSTAEQYIAGSPIVLRAAYVLSGAMTDAELEALKEEYREKNAQLDQAIADAEAAKREWEEKAADLDGVAQEATSQDILTAVQNIDFSTLAKEATLGTPLVGQPSTIFAAIAQSGQDSKQIIADAINQMGGSATAEMTWAQLAAQIVGLDTLCYVKYTSATPRPISPLNPSIRNLIEITDDNYNGTTTNLLWNSTNIKKVKLRALEFLSERMFNNTPLQVLHVPNVSSTSYNGIAAQNLIDILIGGAFVSSFSMSMAGYDPTQAYRTDTSSLCFDTDLEEYGQVFSNNFEKWKWCIINHFAANLQDRTGMNAYTITFGSTVLSHFDAEMIAAFTDKNWTLA